MFPFIGGLNGDGFFGEEYYDDWDQDERSVRNTNGRRRRLSNQTYFNHNIPRSVTCKICGLRNLKWLETSHGWRTAYSTGLLSGKIHSCGSSI